MSSPFGAPSARSPPPPPRVPGPESHLMPRWGWAGAHSQVPGLEGGSPEAPRCVLWRGWGGLGSVRDPTSLSWPHSWSPTIQTPCIFGGGGGGVIAQEPHGSSRISGRWSVQEGVVGSLPLPRKAPPPLPDQQSPTALRPCAPTTTLTNKPHPAPTGPLQGSILGNQRGGLHTQLGPGSPRHPTERSEQIPDP